MSTVVQTSGQPVEVDTSGAGAGTWAASLAAGPATGANNPALSAGQAFVDELPGGGWRCTTQAGPAGVAGPLTLFTCGTGAVGQFGGTFAVQSGASIGGGAGGSLLLGSASPAAGSTFAVNAGSGGGNAGVASGNIRFGTAAPGPGGNQGDWAVTGPGAMLGVQARAAMPANVNATQGGYWGLISGPSSVPMYRDNVGADRQLGYAREETFQAVASNTATVLTAGDVNYHETPGVNFAVSSASTGFSLGATDCIATYLGTITKKFLVRVFCATRATVGVGGDAEWNGCVARNGDVIGTAVGGHVTDGELNVNHTLAAADDLICQGSFERIVTLATGDTVQPAIGRFAGTAVTINVDWLSMTIQEVS